MSRKTAAREQRYNIALSIIGEYNDELYSSIKYKFIEDKISKEIINKMRGRRDISYQMLKVAFHCVRLGPTSDATKWENTVPQKSIMEMYKKLANKNLVRRVKGNISRDQVRICLKILETVGLITVLDDTWAHRGKIHGISKKYEVKKEVRKDINYEELFKDKESPYEDDSEASIKIARSIYGMNH